jgi:ubiquinone/menaquinone biosynthesis C-methylase UbiE
MSKALLTSLHAMDESNHYNQWLCDSIFKFLGNEILDIGSGIGEIARLFCETSDKHVTMSDCSDVMLEHLAHAYSDMGRVSIMKLNIVDDLDPLAFVNKEIDTVTCVNVLEHIDDDLTALKRMRHILPRNGKLALIVPALPFLSGQLDESVGHFRRYTRRTLNPKLVKSCFEVESQFYMNFFGILTWFLSSRILRQRRLKRQVCSKLDKFIPFVRGLEALRRPPIGQTLVTLCRAC